MSIAAEYAEAAQSIETDPDNKRKKVPYAGGGWKHQNSQASQGSQSYHSNSVMRPGAASGGIMVAWHLAEVDLSLHTKEGRNRVWCARLGIGRRSVHYCTDLGKDKVWVHAAVGLPVLILLSVLCVLDCLLIQFSLWLLVV